MRRWQQRVAPVALACGVPCMGCAAGPSSAASSPSSRLRDGGREARCARATSWRRQIKYALRSYERGCNYKKSWGRAFRPQTWRLPSPPPRLRCSFRLRLQRGRGERERERVLDTAERRRDAGGVAREQRGAGGEMIVGSLFSRCKTPLLLFVLSSRLASPRLASP
eukprot:scaffold193878_cov25-Tisochrysis_lutea.AAC.1